MISWLQILITALFSGLFSGLIVHFLDKRSEKQKAENQSKLYVFKTLMETRDANGRLSQRHVQALNLIDIFFYKDKCVTDIWKSYLKLFERLRDINAKLQTENDISKKRLIEHELVACVEEGNDIFLDLLCKMSKLLRYDFDVNHLRRGIYVPKVHVDHVQQMTQIMENVSKLLNGILNGEVSLPVSINEVKNEKK
ncbi:MAG: hypothetical protein PVI75_05750 [Gammaproteobacteria bacterium]|jgi:hypothetical protein